MHKTLLPILLQRDQESSALVIPDVGVFTVGDVLKVAHMVACEIHTVCPKQLESSRVCVLVSSKNPFVFIAGLLGCWLAGVTAACWDEETFSSKDFAKLVSASYIIHPVNLIGDAFEVETLANQAWLDHHRGNLIITTSGSTGSPKGVSLSLDSVALNSYLAGTALGLKGLDGWAIEINFALMSAISHFLMAWQFDLPLVYLKFADQQTKNYCFSSQRLGFGGAPLQLKRYAEERSDSAIPYCLVSSGDFLNESIIKQVQDRFAQSRLYSFYGLTEVSGRFCFMPITPRVAEDGPRATGKPLPGFSYKIDSQLDEHGVGEILIQTPFLFTGYYLQNEKFEQIEPGGWFSTGDLCKTDDFGTIYLHGRTMDVFKVSGEKVDRFSIEDKLSYLFPNSCFCVLPVDHPLIGKCPALFVEADAAIVLPLWKDIVIYLKDKLPSRYIPIYCYRLNKLPRLANGKLDKQLLMGKHESFERLC